MMVKINEKTIEINKEIIKNTRFFKTGGKYYMCYEIPEDDFGIDRAFIRGIKKEVKDYKAS